MECKKKLLVHHCHHNAMQLRVNIVKLTTASINTVVMNLNRMCTGIYMPVTKKLSCKDSG